MKNDKNLRDQYPLVLGATTKTLRTVCTPVEKITLEIKEFGNALLDLMYEYEGVGIAAPQVGKTIRMAAFAQFDFGKRKVKLTMEDVMINPKVISQSDSYESDLEGCLSLPGVEGSVARPTSIVVEYTRLDGTKKLYKAEGYNARIILHEIDHLDGVLFIDKLEKKESLI